MSLLQAMYKVDDFVSEVKVFAILGPWMYVEDKMKSHEARKAEKTSSENQSKAEQIINDVMDDIFPAHEEDDQVIVDAVAEEVGKATEDRIKDIVDDVIDVAVEASEAIKDVANTASKVVGEAQSIINDVAKADKAEETVEVMDVEEEVVAAESKKKQKVDPAEKEHPIDDAPFDPGNVIYDASGIEHIDHTPAEDLSDYQKATFDKLFGKYVAGRKFSLRMAEGNSISCTITEANGQVWTIDIDPGIAIGDGWNVLGKIQKQDGSFDTIPVSAYDKDIISKIFKYPGYVLYPKEIKRCCNRMFKDQTIYHWIDMSGMHDPLKKMSKEDFETLGNKLSFIINALPKDELGRMRFDKFRTVDNFRLVSDSRCKVPFPNDMSDVVSGVKVLCKGDDLTISFKGETFKAKIVNSDESSAIRSEEETAVDSNS